jgi:dienelactone hydrolase
MRRPRAATAFLLGCVALTTVWLGCEKETHRTARREFQSLIGRGLPPDELAAALESFVQAYPEAKTNPHLARACGMLAEHHARGARPDIAASWYERAVLASPDDPDLLNALGYHYARNRMNLDRAVSVLEIAVRLAEERKYSPRRLGFIKDSLGWCYRVRGDLPLAVALLEEACRLAPGVPILRSHLADAYRTLGERGKAIGIYLDLYLEGRGTDAPIRQTLTEIGLEGGPSLSREIRARIEAGLAAIAEADERETESEGATLVRLTAADGYRLVGSLFLPPGRSGRGGAVLLLHALGSGRTACVPAARAIASRGLVALALDLRGHGSSISEDLPDAHHFSADLGGNLGAAGRDVQTALAFLARHPRVDGRRIATIGAGIGGLLAARAVGSSGSAAPSAVVLLSPWGRAEAYQDSLVRLGPGSVLLVSGSEEERALAAVNVLAGALGDAARSIVVPGDASGYQLASDRPDLNDTIAGFLAGRLSVAAPRSVARRIPR